MDLETKLLQVKKNLKTWEAKFVKENDRKPNKDDIGDAPQDVQDNYKKYAKLKHQKNEEKTSNVPVWGAELNKTTGKQSKSDDLSEKEKEMETEKTESCSFMSKLGKKLLERNAHTPTLKKPPPSWGITSFSEPRNTNYLHSERKSVVRHEHFIGDSCPSVEKENVKNIEELSESQVSLQTVLDKVSVKQKLTDSPKVEAQDVLPFNLGTVKKNLNSKYKYVAEFDLQHEEPEGKIADLVVETTKSYGETNIPDDFWDGDVIDESKPFDTSTFPEEETIKETLKPKSWSELCKPVTTEQKSQPKVKSWSEMNEPVDSVRTGTVDKTEIDSLLNRGRKRGNDEEEEEPVRKRYRTEGARRRTRKITEESDEQWPENTGESVVGWKDKNLPVQLDLDNTETSPPEAEKKKPTKSRATVIKPVSNENFVRLNMKIKKYKRKGSHMTGEKHKRWQWKQKMKARSESFGDKCFKCGQPGHWANKCRNQPKPKDIEPESAQPVMDEDFPSLQEAIGMSRGIRKVQVEPDSQKSAKKTTTKKTKSSRTEGTEDLAEDVRSEAPHSDDLDIEMEIYRPGYSAPDRPPSIEPLYPLLPDGSLPEPPDEVMTALNMFGFDTFRPGQKKAVMRILCGLSTLVILSTGSGKSLVYQLAAYLYATKLKAITLVISPLVSLMEDQVTGLPNGVNGVCLHTNMTPSQRKKVTEQITDGNVHFLLVSPEAMTSSTNANSLLGGGQLPSIAFACIDEVHCVSEWSHHFRPSYLRICKVLRDNYGVNCMLGLTATATMVTAASVSQHLGITDYQTSTIRNLPVPSNLLLSASRDQDKDQALLALLQGDRFSSCHSIIIYCTRRQQTERIATILRTSLREVRSEGMEVAQEKNKKGKIKSRKKMPPAGSWSVETYHAGMTPAARKRVQNAFMTGFLRVVVATVAFGMGVDKSDVRGIVHYTMPKSFESYVQEIGRAGRDGKPSHCHVFLDHEGGDINELKRHIYSNTIDRFVLKKLVRKLFVPCKCREKLEESQGNSTDQELNTKRVCPGHERAIPIDDTVETLDIKEEGIATLLCYLELHQAAWLINLQHTYYTCTLQCYGGPRQLQAVAKKCPPVAAAIAVQQIKGASFASTTNLEFPVVTISDKMGWESGIVKRELRQLQWAQGAGGFPIKTGVLVTFSILAFHFHSYGDLTDDELEDVVEFLHERVQTQERTELGQLDRLQKTLRGISHKDVWMCGDQVDVERSDRLKVSLRQYFDEQPELRVGQVTMLSFAREYGSVDQPGSMLEKVECSNIDQLRSDIRQFIHLYSSEHTLNGRVIARIFHGIPSPVFPANIWGRVRRFWRCHLGVDFNLLRKLATQEMISFR